MFSAISQEQSTLKKTNNHFDMGVYLTALNDGKIEVENIIEVNK